MFKFRLAAAALAAAGVLASGAVHAQAYPSKPVTLVIPFAAGGPTDIVGRQLALAMSKSLGQQVVVDNKPGAGGTLAAGLVAKAPADGYMVLLHHIGMSTAPALYRKMTFDPLKDYEYVGQVVDVPMTLVAKKDFPPNDVKELIPYLKANAAKVNLANAGLGAASHLCGLLFMSAIETDLTTVPYKGTAPAMTDLQGGQVDLLCDQTTQTSELIKSGRIKAYAATTSKRLAVLPDLPTLQEGGVKNFEMNVWHGIYAPKGTPKESIDKLNASLREALGNAEFKSAMEKLGAVIVPAEKATPAGLSTFLKAEIDKWSPIIKKAGQYAD
jgi:tripartite-type tricarboxylate transporter receptor subunit TctC